MAARAWAAAVAVGLSILVAPEAASAAPPVLVADQAYGIGGQARGGWMNVNGVEAVTDSTGRRIVLGQSPRGSVKLARFVPAGLLDPSFGDGGRRTVTVPDDTAVARLRIRPDGRLWIVGSTARRVVVVRLTSAGAPDASFGTDGVAIYDPALPSAYEVTVHDAAPSPDGGLTVAASGATRAGLVSRVLVRLAPNGRTDTSFGSSGRAALPSSLDVSARPRSILQLRSGQIALTVESPESTALVRLDPNGTPDQGFGAGGSTLVARPSQRVLDGLVEGPGGSIVVAGFTPSAYLIAKVLANGQRDLSFGTRGGSTLPASGCGPRYAELSRDPAGRFWVTGTRECGVAGAEFGRFLATGAPDATFGTGGYLQIHQHDVDPDGDLFSIDGRSLSFDNSGRVVFGTSSVTFMNDGTQPDIASWRLGPAGQVDGDVDGDARTDIAVWRPTNGTWYVQGAQPVPWGVRGDIPLTGHFIRGVRPAATVGPTTRATVRAKVRAAAAPPKKVARGDLVVWRPGNRTWYIRGIDPIAWGKAGDVPVAGDYNGDGTADLAVWRPSKGTWYVRGANPVRWGVSGDIPVAGDFDGDGVTDLTVWRPSTGKWYIRGGATIQWGKRGDVPVAGDFNGDGRTDIAVWRPSNGRWYVRGNAPVAWGWRGDVPLCGDFTGDGITDFAVWRPSDQTWYVRGREPVPWGHTGDVPVPRAKRQQA